MDDICKHPDEVQLLRNPLLGLARGQGRQQGPPGRRLTIPKARLEPVPRVGRVDR